MRVKVQDVMTHDVVSVNGGTPVKDVAEVLIAHEVSAVPVVDSAGHVIGMISEADLLRKEEFKERYYGEGYRPPLRARLRRRLSGAEGLRGRGAARGDTAAELMTSPVVTTSGHAPLASAVRLMAAHGVKRLPVIDDDGRLQGIVSRRDLLKVFLRSDADIAREVRDDVLGHPLWASTCDVRAQVTQGVVTLHGSMARRSDSRIVVRMAERVHGVVEVIDHLRWEEDDVPIWKDR